MAGGLVIWYTPLSMAIHIPDCICHLGNLLSLDRWAVGNVPLVVRDAALCLPCYHCILWAKSVYVLWLHPGAGLRVTSICGWASDRGFKGWNRNVLINSINVSLFRTLFIEYLAIC